MTMAALSAAMGAMKVSEKLNAQCKFKIVTLYRAIHISRRYTCTALSPMQSPDVRTVPVGFASCWAALECPPVLMVSEPKMEYHLHFYMNIIHILVRL